MHLYLVRNADHEDASRRMWPTARTPLSEIGRLQSLKLSEYFADLQVTAIYSSQLRRAYDTVEPLRLRLGLTVNRRAGFDGISMGDLTGKSHAECVDVLISRRDYDEMMKRPDPSKRYFPNGETLQERAERAWQELQGVVAASRDGDVIVICTHEEVIGAMLCRITNMDLSHVWWWGGRVDPAKYGSITRLLNEGGRWKLLEFGITHYRERS